MAKNLLFLVGCLVAAAIAWGIFQVLGQYTFVAMLVITIVGLLAKVGKPKFGKNSDK
ncbi:hypothetical protein [Hahella sp. KA22]|uniref:hypothetical protein n=1 Tax=Hahella sp. KA22 TaxID=1628392 RepID=UPI0013E2E65E|nr:hypothetical protein [Hahella sp. KA22]